MSQPITPIDYTDKDYSSFRADLLAAIPNYLPEWSDQSPGDFGVVLIELFSYIGDILSYYGDRIANEAYLATAVQRSSVLKLAALIDYRPSDNTAASTVLSIGIKNGAGVTILPKGTQFSTQADPNNPAVIFETTQDLSFVANTSGSTRYTETDDSSPARSIEVVQGVTVTNEALGNSQGIADQVFTLFQSPVIEGSVQVYVDEGDTPQPWTFFDHLTDAAPTDPAFTTFTDDNNIVNVVFGDGTNGRIPNPQAIISATYRVGGGQVGNVGAHAIIQILAVQPNIISVDNPNPAVGGADAESVDHIRAQAPKSLTAINRAVTLGDYAALALKVPSVAKAKATASIFTNITLYIHPAGGYLPATNLGTIVTAMAPMLTNPPNNNGYLDDKKMIGATVTVLPPQYAGSTGYLPVHIAMTVTVLPQYSRDVVQQVILAAINNLLSFDKVDFGMRITQSSLYHTVMAVEGVDFLVLNELRREDQTAGSVQDVFANDNEIPNLATVSITMLGGAEAP